MPKSRVRVVMEHMGGGFGAKNHAGSHTYAAAILARRTGRAGALRAGPRRRAIGHGTPRAVDDAT